MSYSGYGFSSNSAHPSRQAISNTQSSSTPSSSWQNADRTYSQKEYGWQEQIPSLHGSNTSHSENPCWSSSNDAQIQSQNYPPQVTSRNSQSGQYTAPHSGVNQSHVSLDSSAVDALYNSTRAGSTAAPIPANPSSRANFYYSGAAQAQSRTPSPNVHPSYQQSGSSLDLADRSDSAQRSRNAAASAMTVLSSSVPARRFSQSVPVGSSSIYSDQTQPYISTVHNAASTRDSSLPEYSANPALAPRQNTTHQRPATSQPPAVEIGQRKDTLSSTTTNPVSYSSPSGQPFGTIPPPNPAHHSRHSQSIATTSAPSYGSSRPNIQSNSMYSPTPVDTRSPKSHVAHTQGNTDQHSSSEIHNQDATHINMSRRNNLHGESHGRRLSNSPSQTSLPTFVDPSKINYEQARASYSMHSTQAHQTPQTTFGESNEDTSVEQALVIALTGNTVQFQTETGERPVEAQAPPETSTNNQAETKSASYPRKPSPNRRCTLPAAQAERADANEPSQEMPQAAQTRKRGRPRKAPQDKLMNVPGAICPSRVLEPDLSTTAQDESTKGSMEENMASEMRQMIEKMRQWRSKDPSLFAKLWDDVKKGPSTDASQPPSASKASIANPAPKPANGQSSMDPPAQVTPAESLPDLGKFPAARRKRFAKNRLSNVYHAMPEMGSPKATTTPIQQQKVSQAKATVDENKRQPTHFETPEPRRTPLSSYNNTSQEDKVVQTTTTPIASLKEVQTPQDNNRPEPQPKPKETKASNIWPLAKRQALAEAACNYLQEVPQNAGKDCPTSLILNLIDQDPSYTQLCEMLEVKGLSVNRVHFAKHLLKAVPDLSSSAQPKRPANSDAITAPVGHPSEGNATTSVPVQSHPPSRPVSEAPRANTAPSPSIPPPTYNTKSQVQMTAPLTFHHFTGVSTTISQPPQSTLVASQDASQPTQSAAASSIPQSTNPATLPRPPPMANLQQSSKQAPPTSSQPFFPPLPPVAKLVPLPSETNSTTPSSNAPRFEPPKVVSSQVPMGQVVQSPITAHSFIHFDAKSSKVNAKRTSETSAPAPPPASAPPGSKEALAKKRNFSEIVDLTRSLSDDEDMVDVADVADAESASKIPRLDECRTTEPLVPATEPTPAPSSTVDLSRFKLAETTDVEKRDALRRRKDIVKPFNKAEALRKTYYNPKTIARDVLIAAGRHPTERPLNYHLLKLRVSFQAVDYNSDLRTFRWDLVDPGSPPPEVALAPLPSRPPIPSRPPNSDLNSDASTTELYNRESRGSEVTTTPQRAVHRQSAEIPKLNSSPSKRNVVQIRPFHTFSSNSTPLMPESTALPRRQRGRPAGSKNKPNATGSVSRAVEVVVRPGPYASPLYREYICSWKDCNAKLHNLETLKKHVVKLHVPPSNHSTPCQWSGCASSRSQHLFGAEELQEHLDKMHLRPMAWKYGEGPTTKGSVLSIDPENCSKDQNGRSYTPRISERGPHPALIFPAASSSIKSFNKIHGNKTERAKALEVLRALETKQARVGIGVNKGGCTLFNYKRLPTVVAFENVRRIIPAEKK
ncbi:hypothetical protein D8B26_002570 [Coccidioides posadasii str. Silveira]|uniref:Uncharacterized protein n=1 Tax=Coccidioides posadasii (strain RMSCC 757 / Silveira) TaxID=443226 RepID=E9DIT1_COCPS|nr:conserved hypothetical protein [Coccidioides posadasii str. Silveira]QVM07876.1 hypothetical protein D8B26_002570 [Coccidioides posadasii str. Silveira]